MDALTPSTHGGSRPGAGRKPGAKNKAPASTWTVQVRVDAALEEALKNAAAESGKSPATLAREILEKALLMTTHNTATSATCARTDEPPTV